ncbi:hypothetical protein SAMN04487983_102770 [Streptomyces sp. yr375]|uniref:hypothetical protein n=1 Tax=Streptomyces sp. yr375 TaxID=1761906 RepID=UPI0008C6C259|nr:hypothetical protein [Streptomyces sp. yr375]SES00852.1 hypothetical protein SAMN04487983_102770 [Streptomyces sp. yr375]
MSPDFSGLDEGEDQQADIVREVVGHHAAGSEGTSGSFVSRRQDAPVRENGLGGPQAVVGQLALEVALEVACGGRRWATRGLFFEHVDDKMKSRR